MRRAFRTPSWQHKLAAQGDPRAALDRFIKAREIAEQRLGSDQLVTIQAARFAALQAQAAGLVDVDAVDVAVRELGFALSGARQAYPLSANEITELTNEYANVLTQAQKHAQAAEVVEQRFDDEVAFPRESHVLMVAQLNDGVLTGEEIVAQDLRGTELVTLSVAPKVPFSLPFGGLPESEVLGMLPHAFQLAGARAVLSNDWETNQPATQRLMIAFYKQLASGKEKAAALRAAQLEIRDDSGAEPMPATFWANFRLTGEGWKSAGEQAASSTK